MNNIEKLPDSYEKGSKSNNYKLLFLNECAIYDIIKDINLIYDILDINNAYGIVLDNYGSMFGQLRGAFDDIVYRYMIKVRIFKNMIKGDYASIKQAITQMFNCGSAIINSKDISIKEVKSGLVRIEKMPFNALLNAGINTKQAVKIIKELLPIGVNLEAYAFEGTFEFSDNYNIYDEISGFADDSSSIGGILGCLYGED